MKTSSSNKPFRTCKSCRRTGNAVFNRCSLSSGSTQSRGWVTLQVDTNISNKIPAKKTSENSLLKPHSEGVILPLWEPVQGCRTAVADAVVSCRETGGGAPGSFRADLWHFRKGTRHRPHSHTAGHCSMHTHHSSPYLQITHAKASPVSLIFGKIWPNLLLFCFVYIASTCSLLILIN